MSSTATRPLTKTPIKHTSNMDTCVEFLITDIRLGAPTQRPNLWSETTAASIEILNPIRDAMIKRGLIMGKIRGGKPWGSACTIGKGKSRACLYFCPVPSFEKKRWEGSIRVDSAPPFWRELTKIRDNSAEEQMIEPVVSELKPILAGKTSITGLHWMSLQQLCSSKGYEDL